MSGYSREEGFPRCESVEDWTIEDPFGAAPGLYQRIFEEIEQRVSELAERLRGEVQAAKPDREG
jgi:protein-tyrosine-phosphatase